MRHPSAHCLQTTQQDGRTWHASSGWSQPCSRSCHLQSKIISWMNSTWDTLVMRSLPVSITLFLRPSWYNFSPAPFLVNLRGVPCAIMLKCATQGTFPGVLNMQPQSRHTNPGSRRLYSKHRSTQHLRSAAATTQRPFSLQTVHNRQQDTCREHGGTHNTQPATPKGCCQKLHHTPQLKLAQQHS